ncbi:hypothetical protein EHM92_07515 [bacterium]|nr:MAG: hypothetical protein EHM92_07515 [bacterium]
MTKEETLQLVEQEFATARQAAAVGNDGMVRVCARRAAGAAIAFWLQSNDRPGWRPDAMSRIRHLEADSSFPQEVRDAAMRLSARVTPQFTPRYSNDPVEDSNRIIRHLLG